MRVIPVPCLSDNYAYLVTRDGSDEAFVVDPSESRAGHRRRSSARGSAWWPSSTRTTTTITSGGNEGAPRALRRAPRVRARERRGPRPRADRARRGGQAFHGRRPRRFAPLHVPGHTLGAVAYVVEDAVFTGDTLFVAGCGRLFEGTPAHDARLALRQARPPPARRRASTAATSTPSSNLRFAVHAEPDNQAARRQARRARRPSREKGEPTVPTTIGEELATNPFLRSEAPSIAANFPGAGAVDVFAAVRKAKDTFR